MRKYKKLLAGVLITTLLSSIPYQAYAVGWIKSETVPSQTGVSSWWYSTNATNDTWYSGEPLLWQWLDANKDGTAECYAFNEAGWMFANTTTPDGYIVNEDGAWVIDGIIQTKSVPITTAKTTRRSGSGGGGGGGGSSSGSNTTKPKPDPQPEIPEPKPEPPKVEEITYSYTVFYKDIDSRTVLRQEVGRAEKDSIIEIEQLHFDDYMLCDNQPESFRLSHENLKETVYYQKVEEASASDAEEIRWEVNFVDAETHQKQIFPQSSGIILEGGSLYINYMERVTVDGVLWEALQTPPFEAMVYGPGDEIYYIEFVDVGTEPEPEDPHEEEQARLQEWLSVAKETEGGITGELPEAIPDSRFIIANKVQNDTRIRSIANAIIDAEPYTFYIIGKNYIPNGLAIVDWYGGSTDYSIILEDTIVVENDTYSIVRINLSLSPDADNCHHWMLVDENQATCVSKGSQTYQCENCGEEKEAYIPALGHTDDDGDTICDICGEFIGTEPVGTHWNLGDIQVQELDGEVYFFECIDLNYSDRAENHNKMALFLCTSVVPANYGSGYKYEKLSDGTYGYVFYPGPITSFGSSNDYKYSAIRKWLGKLESDTYNLGDTSIGVSYAYMGATAEGTGEQMQESDLATSYIGNQKMTDRLFILSIDEALKYKEYLWEVDETGAYQKGYWLRSPMGTSGQHNTGYVYIVDLVNENIRPQSISTGSGGTVEEIEATGTTGVRLAYTMPQN